MKKAIVSIIIAAVILSATVTAAVASDIGSGAEVVASEVNLIKTGLKGQNLNFSDTDFKSALGVSDFDKLTITTLPSSTEGTLMLGERRVGEGQSIRRRNVSNLTFVPASAQVEESGFTFTVDECCGGADIECVIKLISKINYAPKIGEDASLNVSVTTQEGICVWGQMEAEDPEGDELEYIIVSYPEEGVLKADTASGEFSYIPNDGYSGKDSFIYVARDEYGNYSKTQKVSIKITERMSEVVYVDMTESRSYNAAVAMTAMGIMSGKRVGDDMYFMPEEAVTRAEFVAMAMKVMGIRADSTLTETFFDDNDEIPASLVSYVATAQRCGIVNGAFDGEGLKFRPNDAITKYEAAIVMSALVGERTDITIPTSLEGLSDIPVWARSDVGIMCALGIFEHSESATAKEALNREAVAEYLYRLASVD